MGAYDLVLGMAWLEHHNPMTCDWLHKSIEFTHDGSRVKLQGLIDKPVTTLTEISGEEIMKCSKGSDLWAVVLVELVPQHLHTHEKLSNAPIPF